MSLPYIIRPRAREDIDAAHLWYELQTTGRGDAFLIELRDLIDAVCSSPERFGRVRGEVRAAPLPHSKFIMYYRVEAGIVSILAVLHAAADPRKWQRRK
jgi:plasmid stabilization system protein ParE